MATTCAASAMLAKTDGSRWVVDSGATQHMCRDLNAFLKERKTVDGKVFLGDSSSIPVSFSGSVRLELLQPSTAPCPVTLKDVLAVEDLSRNLLSVSSCLKNGVDVNFFDASRECHLMREGKLLGRALEENSLWVLQAEHLNTPPP